MSKTLLIELVTEELPPKALKRLSEAFAELFTQSLTAQGFVSENSEILSWGTPRRLAVTIKNVAGHSLDYRKMQKVLPVAVAFDEKNQPTTPLLRKLTSLGLSESDIPKLKRMPDGKTEALFFDSVIPGKSLTEGVQEALDAAIAYLPIPKVMHYPHRGGYYNDVSFVRPVHGLVALYGGDVLPVKAFGLDADRVTQGHRFLATSPTISIDDADHYERLLEQKGKVIVSFAKRRKTIEQALKKTAQQDQAANEVIAPDTLLDEVTSLVEWPTVYCGTFDPAFLEVPQECLILTMQQNQKYFALTDTGGKLVEHFLVVSNIETEKPEAIVDGNARVLRARLADARFFYEQDAKTPLAQRVDKLAHIIYFKGLGSQYDRIQRIKSIAQTLAKRLQANSDQTGRIAFLAKADLTTDMVGEFPELQGIMGRYYALHDREPEIVANGIEQHYWPRFSGDTLPESMEAIAVAIADKIESIFGMFAIGNTPTGDKDPFGLRRAAIGILRIIMERALPLSITELLADTRDIFERVSIRVVDKKGKECPINLMQTATQAEAFFHDRLRGLLKEQGYGISMIEAVLAQCPDLASIPKRLEAVRSFLALPEAAALAAANKRIVNILKKSGDMAVPAAVCPDLFLDAAEKALYDIFANTLSAQVETAMRDGNFTQALLVLATARDIVDRFFDEVMVMADDEAVRNNRLALLGHIRTTMNGVAEIALLAG